VLDIPGGLGRNRTTDTRIFNPSYYYRTSSKLKFSNEFLDVQAAEPNLSNPN